ncbi:MAG TPA: hypothetical protein VEY91_08125 [Candidatus Limnocylindria bacterium]|nr:hypothetical protein [Candidatus Limnocylindria bacterium]
MPDKTLDPVLNRWHRAYRRALVTRHALRAAAGCIAAIAVMVLAGLALPVNEGSAWLRLAVVLGLCMLAIGAGVAGFLRRVLRLDAYLQLAESRFPELRSWLRNALELERRPPEHGSRELAGALAAETKRRLEEAPLARLTPAVGAKRPGLATAAAAAGLAAAALLAPLPTARSWATLWDPSSAAPPVRLEVEPGSVKLSPGAALAVRARIWGTERAPRLLRSGQAAVTAVAEGPLADGGRLWRFDLVQLTRDQDYQVRVAAVTSPRYRISLAGEPAPVSFEMEYRAPSYARLPVQRGTATRGDLTALAGTTARLVVTFDRDLTALNATLPDGRARRWTPVTPRRWQGDVPVARAGQYELHAVASGGESRSRYRITPVDDAPPVLVVRLPEGDMDLPAGQQVPLEALGQDDLGLTELKLEYRKDPAAPWAELPLARFEARPREARVASRWDASVLAMLPGETATFRFVLFDDNAIRGRGRTESPTFELRFPSLADLYDNVDERQNAALTTLEKVADQAKELQKSLDKLGRQPSQRAAPQSPQAYQRSEELKTALERQAQLGQQIDEAARDLQQSIDQAAERQAFDQELMRKLRELGELVQQVQSQEFKEAMRRMQEAMEQLDRNPLEQELPRWRQENQEMLANLQRTIELLKRLREEERLQSLAQRAEELKAQQDALNREHAGAEPKRDKESPRSQEEKSRDQEALSEQQQRAAEESEQLAQETREAAGEMEQQDERESMEKASEEMKSEAAPAQREAAESSQQNQKQQAQKSGSRASQSLERAAKRMRQVAKSHQQEQEQLDLAALRRAAQDLVSLQRSAEQNLKTGEPLESRANRQTDLSEGTSRVADSLFTLSRQTPFISPQLAQALGRAINQLSQSGREMGGGNRAGGDESGRRASESLNEAVLELRASESSMCQGQGTGEPGPKPGQRQMMGQLGERQGQLNQRSKSLAQRLSEQMRLSSGDRGELERMADEQARIRQQLEEVQKTEEARRKLLGRLDQTQREMKEVEEVLRSGAVDGTLEQKQQRILSRLLDAQRSLNRRDFDPQRESRPGEDVARSTPPELPADLLRESDRLRLDLLKAEADRYPAQYRAFVEAYLKSLNGSSR